MKRRRLSFVKMRYINVTMIKIQENHQAVEIVQ